MKRWCLTLLAALALMASGTACVLVEWDSYSPNHRYKIRTGTDGISVWQGNRRLWWHPLEPGLRAAVSDQGDLAVCQRGQGWVLFNRGGQEVARTEGTPLQLELDPPRTCWTSHGFYFLETSQGDIYQFRQQRWCRVANPGTTPQEVAEHQAGRVADKRITEFLRERYSDVPPPNFRWLSSAQIGRLMKLLHEGNARAGLVLALANKPQAREALLSLTCSPNRETAVDAQQAIVLLDGADAAPELVPALQGWASDVLLSLYEEVACPQAIPGLLRQLSHGRYSRPALVAQTRVDLGDEEGPWKEWLAHKDRARLQQYQEPSLPLWQAQREDPALYENLLKEPRLVAQFELGGTRRERIVLLGERLIRRCGGSRSRTLEWSLKDGRSLLELAPEIPSNSQFQWNRRRQLLYYSSAICFGLYRGEKLLFGQHNEQGVRERFPPGLQMDLSEVESADERPSRLGFLLYESLRLRGQPTLLPRMTQALEEFRHSALGRLREAGIQAASATESPDQRLIAVEKDSEIVLLDGKSLKLLRTIPHLTWPDQLTFDESGRRLAVVADNSAYVYDLRPGPPDPSVDKRLLTECWTGYRLWAGGARRLTAAEYWQRRKRLAQPPLPEASYLLVGASSAAIALLAFAYVFLAVRAGSRRPGACPAGGRSCAGRGGS